MITDNGERNPNLGKSTKNTSSKAAAAKEKAQAQGKARTEAEKKKASAAPKPTSSTSTSGSLNSVSPTTSTAKPSSSPSSSSSSSSGTKKKTLSQAEKSAALSDLMNRETIGSSKYGLSFQSSANQQISASEEQRKKSLVEQATKNGYLVGQNTSQAQGFRDTVNQKFARAILSGKSPEDARNDEQQRIQKSAAAQKSVIRDQEKGRNRTASELERQIKTIDKEIGESTKATGRPDMQKVAERNKLTEQKRAVTNDYSVLESLGRSVEAGAGGFNSGVTSALNAGRNALMDLEAILNGGWDKESKKFVKGGSPITASLLQPIADLDTYTKDTTAGLQQSAAERWGRYGKAGNIANQLAQGTMSAVPNAVLAMATAGGSTAATLAPQASGIAATVTDAVQKLSSNPMYWTSFIQSFGNGYDEAIEKGASEDEALLATLLSSTANAIVEIGGGVEQLPSEIRKEGLTSPEKFRKWVSSSLDEGKEEVIQGMIERLVNKAVYDQDAPWVSLQNEDAVINPLQSAQEGAMGAAIGGIMGGGQMLVQNAIDARRSRVVDPTATPTDQAILDALQGVETPENVTPVQETTALDDAIAETFMQGQSGITPDVATNKPKDVKNLLNATKEQISRFIQNAFNKQNQYQFLKLSDVSPELAETLRANGIEVEGYAHALRDNDLRHVDNSHGSKSNDKYKVTPDALSDVQNVIENYDNLYRGFDTKNGNPTVVYEKQMGNRTFYVEEVLDEGMLGTKQMVITGENSNPSFLKKYTKIASTLSETDVPTRSGSKGISPPGNHVPDAESSTSYNPNVAQSYDSVNSQNQVIENDLGAMRSQFESHPEQSQTQVNTLGAIEYETDVPPDVREPIMYDTISEEKSLDNARLRLEQDYDGEMRVLQKKHNWSGEEVDMGMTILDNYRRAAEETGDWTQYSDWRKTVSEHGTAAGQALQAYAKYSRQTGGGIIADAAAALDGRVKKSANKDAILNQVSNLAGAYDRAVGKGQQNAEVDVDALLKIIDDAGHARKTNTMIGNKQIIDWATKRIANYARAEAQGDGGANLDFLKTFAANSIYNIAADAQKTSAGNQIKAARRMAMLSKGSTIMRNLVSNNVFDPIDSIARDVSVPLDILLSKFTGTRSVALDASWLSKAKRKGSIDGLARACMEVGLDVDTSGSTGKYESSSNRTFKMADGVFSKLMSTWELAEGYALNATDEFQKGGIEASVQEGIDKLYKKGKISDDSLRNAGEQEALYRTFQDETVLSDVVTGIRRGLNKIHVGDLGAGDVTIPFAQVPSNLGARAIEYSPAGLFVAAVDFGNAINAATKGEFTAAQQAKAVQGVGRALTGTGMIAIAAAGALRGWLKVTGDDDDKNKDAAEKAQGMDGTQLNVSSMMRDLLGKNPQWADGDKLVSIGFLDPINAQLTTGALIAEDIRNMDTVDFKSIMTNGNVFGNSFSGALQSVLDLPVMSTLREVQNNYQNSEATTEGGKLADAVGKYVAGQMSSLIPNSIRGIAQGLDDTERDTYTSDNYWQQAVDNAKASIPVLRETLPAKKDAWGNDVKNEGGYQNFMNRNIRPGNITTYHADDVTDELGAVSDATGESLYPQRYAPRSIEVDGEKVALTDAQRDTYQETYGADYYNTVKALEQNEGYQRLPNDVKATILKKARKIAEDAAKESVEIGFEMSAENKAIAEKDSAERVNDLIADAIKQDKYIPEEAQKSVDAIEEKYDASEEYQTLPDNVLKTAKKALEKYYADVEAAKYGGELSDDDKKLEGMSEEELANHFISSAIGTEKYMPEEARQKLENVKNIYNGAVYAGVSDDLIESAREKAEEYFQNAEKAKFGYKLSEERKDLDKMNQKTIAEYFLDAAVAAKYDDKNGDGTKADEVLAAYENGEINDKLALATLDDKVVDAYADFGKAAGVTPQMVLETQNQYARFKEEKDIDDVVTLSVEAQLDDWLEKQGWREEQVAALRRCYYDSKPDSYNKLVEKLDRGDITVGEAKKSLTPTYQYGWTHNASKTGISMQDYISCAADFENAPNAKERDAMGYDSKWEWYVDHLKKNTDLTKEQMYAVAISTDRSMQESTKQKIARAIGVPYVRPTTEEASGSSSSSSGASSNADGGTYWGGGTSTEKKELTQAEKAYERFGKAAGATESMYDQAKSAMKGIKTVYDMDGNEVRSAEDQFDSWLERQEWTQDQKDAVRAGFYADSVKNLQWLSNELREGNISVASAKSELSPRMQTGWSKNVLDTGASMAEYIDAFAQFKQAPNADERKAMGYGSKWEWFCDYLNSTDMTAEQKYKTAASVQDYADSTMQKIASRLGYTPSEEEAAPQEETYDLRTDDGYRAYLSLLMGRTKRYEAADGSIWTLSSDGEVLAKRKDGKVLRVRAILGKNGFEDEAGDGYTVSSKAGVLAYKMMQNGVMKTWDAPDGWTWKLSRGEIIAEKNGTKLPVRYAG